MSVIFQSCIFQTHSFLCPSFSGRAFLASPIFFDSRCTLNLQPTAARRPSRLPCRWRESSAARRLVRTRGRGSARSPYYGGKEHEPDTGLPAEAAYSASVTSSPPHTACTSSRYRISQLDSYGICIDAMHGPKTYRSRNRGKKAVSHVLVQLLVYCYYYSHYEMFDAPCVGHKDDESQARRSRGSTGSSQCNKNALSFFLKVHAVTSKLSAMT